MKRRAVIVNRLNCMKRVEYTPISMEEYEYYVENGLSIPDNITVHSRVIDKEQEEELIRKSKLYNYGIN